MDAQPFWGKGQTMYKHGKRPHLVFRKICAAPRYRIGTLTCLTIQHTECCNILYLRNSMCIWPEYNMMVMMTLSPTIYIFYYLKLHWCKSFDCSDQHHSFLFSVRAGILCPSLFVKVRLQVRISYCQYIKKVGIGRPSAEFVFGITQRWKQIFTRFSHL